MKKLFVAAVAALTVLASAAVAAAALDPGVYDPGNTGCVKATYVKKTLHLEKNCPTTTNVAALGEITGLTGQTFQSAEFTLANAAQCKGGSPRFLVITSTGSFPLGCNNVAPIQNANGTATYVFTAATLAAAGQQVSLPTGAISYIVIILDAQGVADLTNIKFNGIAQTAVTTHGKGVASACKNGAWKAFTTPKFKNQGQCVKHMVHSRNAAKKTARG
ncbi:MAG TPA: hypothetical protein VM049_10290 [Gaiellaceae bacterium]|nr:hypothetical protein [Gaiellaceae bacterium]